MAEVKAKPKGQFEFFFERSSPFSNWHPSQFALPHPASPTQLVVYGCVEQRMMHVKAHKFGDIVTGGRILATKLPEIQKRLGRDVKNYKEAVWAAVRRDVVKQAQVAKYRQNPRLLNRLLAVKVPFAEASPYDKIWGIGMRASDPRAATRCTWRGSNLLGDILTEVRDEFLAQGWKSQPSGIPKRVPVVAKKA
jgi:ribA/ribD-fused uncharacterized protein